VLAKLLPALVGIDEIVLITVGTLALLPWHASPLPAPGPGATHVIDQLCIRYAPIASALAMDVPHQPSFVYFAAHNPQPANGVPLPLSELEVASCAQRFAQAQIVSGAAATAEALIAGLDACDVFHFAGHAASDLRLPLNGGLEVAGPTRLTLERLLAEQHSGRLAVLSACETGVPGLRLPEEAISLSSGFLQVGFTGVIASLWPVSDFSTFFVMDRFYAAWPAQERDPGVALRDAQRWLRDASAVELAQELERHERLLDHPPIAKLHRQLRAAPPAARPFSALFSWAPFSLWGA
jgi:CHAT domain-containing protein